MNVQLRLITELQKLDSIMLAARMKIDTIPDKISSHEGPLKEAEAACEKSKQNHAALEKKKKDRERSIEDANEKINKLKQKTSDVKTNKEYQALLKEMESAEKEIRSAEDDILSIMESLEESSKLLKKEDDRIAGEKSKVDAIKKELEKEVSQHEDELKKLKEDRKKIVEKIERGNYDQYMILLKALKGLAVAEAKNEICQGCNLHIPPQMFVELKKNDEIVNCPQCRRILYYSAPEPENNTQ